MLSDMNYTEVIQKKFEGWALRYWPPSHMNLLIEYLNHGEGSSSDNKCSLLSKHQLLLYLSSVMVALRNFTVLALSAMALAFPTPTPTNETPALLKRTVSGIAAASCERTLWQSRGVSRLNALTRFYVHRNSIYLFRSRNRRCCGCESRRPG
jgi:hypothetical protein